MVSSTIEYMILTPVLILLIFLLPFMANGAMNYYSNGRQELELKTTASHLGSTIQQVYFSLNHDSVSTGPTITSNLEIPPLIETSTYTVNCTSRTAVGSGALIVDLKLKLSGSGVTAISSVTLGQNAVWTNSYFWSNSVSAHILATKSGNTIQLSITS
jgi:hypothetical protein